MKLQIISSKLVLALPRIAILALAIGTLFYRIFMADCAVMKTAFTGHYHSGDDVATIMYTLITVGFLCIRTATGAIAALIWQAVQFGWHVLHYSDMGCDVQVVDANGVFDGLTTLVCVGLIVKRFIEGAFDERKSGSSG
jgi:hypothetical protein